MTDWAEDMLTLATRAGGAFEELRAELEQAAREQEAPPEGTLVGGRYRVVREIGQGGFGNVYEVRHDLLGHRFAMKLLNARIASDPDWVARFREEARATSLIGHECIVFVTDFGEDDEWGSYFVMEYLEGRPLDRVLADEGTQPPERVLRFLHAAASTLGAVHEVGIIHCDLKPSNVFVVPRSRQPELWKFLDFGTSTVVMETVETDALYGTPKYMAPEQSIGDELSPLADQFSIGCIVYEMVTGEVPWDVTSWLKAMPEFRAKEPPAAPSEIADGSPPAWDEPIMRAISIDPADRWPSIDAFARALGERLDVDWKPTSDPLDIHRQEGSGTFERTSTAPSVEIVQPDGAPSVVVDVESGEESEERPLVRVGFQTRERFMREYRRNLSVGGLFVPCEDLLPLRSGVRVELVFTPTGDTCEFQASVVGHETRREAGRGFGLAVERGESAIDDFVELIRGMSQRLEANEIESVLERVDFHRNQANYLGARDVLRRAISASPDVAEFHHRLALLRDEVDDDVDGAIAAARKAVELDPEDATHQALLDSLLGRSR